MYVNIRPFLRKCIMKLKKLYQVVVWTASTQDYADAIINHIDPYYELFEARYYRDNCVRTEQSVHMKDMRMFWDNWKLKDIILVDNSVHCFGIQLNNGFPIRPFYNNKKDMEFIKIADFLCKLYYISDVRNWLKYIFTLEKLKNNEVCNELGEDSDSDVDSSEPQNQDYYNTSTNHEQELKQAPSFNSSDPESKNKSEAQVSDKNVSVGSKSSKSKNKKHAINSLGNLLDKIEKVVS